MLIFGYIIKRMSMSLYVKQCEKENIQRHLYDRIPKTTLKIVKKLKTFRTA